MKPMKWEWTGKEATLEDVLFNIPPGWADLVTKLIEDLFALGWDGTVTQVKEKLGGLRFYFRTSGIPDDLKRVASAVEWYYESQSVMKCEQCGRSGRCRSHKESRWLKTLCKDHAKEKGYELFDYEGQLP